MRDRLMLAALLLAVTLAALPVLTYPLGRDQGEFATIGRGILDGHIPYVDLWNPKPPAVFYVYAAAMAVFGRTTAALRAIDFIIVPIISLCLCWLGQRIANRRVGLWAALLFPVFYFTETFWTLTQNDGIVLLPMTLAIVCAFKAWLAPERRGQLLWSFAAGIFSGYLVWFKYPFALFALVLLLGYFLNRRGMRLEVPSWSQNEDGRYESILLRRDPLLYSAALVFIIGIVVVLGAGAVYLYAIGALPDLIESARVTSQYTALTFNAQDFGELLQTHWGFRWQHWGLLWVFALLWFVVTRPGRTASTNLFKPEWRMIVFWLAAGFLIMLVQAKAYDYHWLPMLPPLTILAADFLDDLVYLAARIVLLVVEIGSIVVFNKEPTEFHFVQEWWTQPLARRTLLTIEVLTALTFLCIMIISIWPRAWPYLTGQESRVEYYSQFQAGEFVADESLQVANYLRERVAPGDSLFIWGFRPEVYYLSQLNPAVRFIFQFPLVADWYPQEWKQETVDILWAALPPYVLVLQADYMPWVTGSDDDSNTLLQSYTELNDWLIFNYEPDAQIGSFFLWRRKSQ